MKQVLLPSRRHENRGLKQGGFYRETSLIHQKGGEKCYRELCLAIPESRCVF